MMSAAAAEHAAAFSWDHTTDALLASYRRAIGDFTAGRRRRVRDLVAVRKPRRWTARRGVGA
ncbi:D-inositol-3-phosphate glycosyltransferase domain protein [Mycobacterium kansasii 732]|nr:D-inositol-3-phosphate glycosyltransferase domain protein [Mycobacterium kansasii 732]